MRILTILILLLAVAVGVPAATLSYDVMLNGAQAGAASPGTGHAYLVLDDVANTLWVDLSYSGLLAPVANAHIHCCAVAGKNAGVIIPFVPPMTTGATSGTFTNLFNISATQVSQVESYKAYINIHTSAYPGGEIRGQITPEPATFGLLGAALAGVFFLRRRLS